MAKKDVEKVKKEPDVIDKFLAQIDGIKAQKNDPGLSVGRRITSRMEEKGKNAALELTERVGKDLVRTLRLFSADGRVGGALSKIAAPLVGDDRVQIPKLDSLGNSVDPELLLAALFDLRFQRALYGFQLSLSKSNLGDQQKMIAKYMKIKWTMFSDEDRGWFSNNFGLISAGAERSRVRDLQLEDVIPLMMVPQFLDIITVSEGYAHIMDASLSSYSEHRKFLNDMGGDNREIMKEIDELLKKITTAEASRLERFDEVVATTDVLTRLMETATLIADLTNRTSEARAMKAAGDKLASALENHSRDTLESQEAYLQQYMLLNQILVSNQAREGHLSSAMASLDLYIKSYRAFVLILTALQVYLLSASATLKKYLADSLEGQSRKIVEEIYIQGVNPLNRSLNQYARGFAPKQSHGNVIDLPADELLEVE